MKKKLLTVCVCAAMVMSLAACGGSDNAGTSADTAAQAAAEQETAATEVVTTEAVTTEADNSDTAASAEAEEEGNASYTLQEGKLMVGMEIGYPPMEYFDTDGATPIGFDVEVAKAVADYLGLEVEYVDTAWDGIFAGVNTDKYDVIFSCVSITPARQEEFNISKPYVSNHTVLIVPNDSEIDSLEALNGHSTAVQAETTADDYMKEHGAEIGVELFQYDKVINCFDDLKTGRVDSVFTDSVVAAYYLGDEAANYKTVWENEELEPIGFCVKKGNDELTNKLEEAIDALYADGTMATIAEKYFGSDLTAGLR
ncbi:MAG: amino acid ABC transporter substrate-binding protein [Lachnospiraceae bacterium]|nr:amino acid ABC transporter substrate-binding protein [Lachnospiraceae bacterium]